MTGDPLTRAVTCLHRASEAGSMLEYHLLWDAVEALGIAAATDPRIAPSLAACREMAEASRRAGTIPELIDALQALRDAPVTMERAA